MTRATRIALGEAGFERATVWSAVGFALSYVAFDALPAAIPSGDPLTGTVATLGVLALLTAVGVTAFAAVGGGALPAILLAYGPTAAALLRTAGPEPYAIPFGDPVPFLRAIAEPLAVAGAGAVAVGLAGYVAGRVAAGYLAVDSGSEGDGVASGSDTDDGDGSPADDD